MTDWQNALLEIQRGADEILLQEELVAKLKEGKALKIKALKKWSSGQFPQTLSPPGH